MQTKSLKRAIVFKVYIYICRLEQHSNNKPSCHMDIGYVDHYDLANATFNHVVKHHKIFTTKLRVM